MATQTPTKPTAAAAEPAGTPRRPKAEGAVMNVFSHAFLWLWALMVVIPVVWIILSSFKTTREIAADPLGRGEADTFASVALRLQKHRAHVYRALGEEMRTAYLPFSPDADTLPDPTVTPEVRGQYERRLSALTHHLLDRANYRRLTNDEITAILSELGERPGAAQRLMPLVYEELRALARSYFAAQPADHTLQPTALVHEAYFRLVRTPDVTWSGRAHFFAVAAMAMRQILGNHAEARLAEKRGGKRSRVGLTEVLDAMTRQPGVVASARSPDSTSCAIARLA